MRLGPPRHRDGFRIGGPYRSCRQQRQGQGHGQPRTPQGSTVRCLDAWAEHATDEQPVRRSRKDDGAVRGGLGNELARGIAARAWRGLSSPRGSPPGDPLPGPVVWKSTPGHSSSWCGVRTLPPARPGIEPCGSIGAAAKPASATKGEPRTGTRYDGDRDARASKKSTGIHPGDPAGPASGGPTGPAGPALPALPGRGGPGARLRARFLLADPALGEGPRRARARHHPQRRGDHARHCRARGRPGGGHWAGVARRAAADDRPGASRDGSAARHWYRGRRTS